MTALGSDLTHLISVQITSLLRIHFRLFFFSCNSNINYDIMNS